MKENKLCDIISKIDTDASMDQRIKEKLLTHEVNAGIVNPLKCLTAKLNMMFKVSYFRAISKVAAAVLIFAVVGTATAWAASYFFKSYPAEFEVIPEVEHNSTIEKEVTAYGEGHKNERRTITDSDGNVIESYGPEDPNDDDIKYGNEVFAALGLPNLIPTYLYDNFLLEEGGYRYIEQKYDEDTIYKSIKAGFYSENTTKYVFIDFNPSDTSTEDSTIMYADDTSTKESFHTTTYVTDGGLICNLINNTEDEHETTSATIFYDSETLGNACYLLSFSNIERDEIEAILDSIPITITNNK
jgi:Ni,Fe-hydrogenase I large subunit